MKVYYGSNVTIEAIIRVYNDKICRIIDNYNGSAYYEPSYYLTRCYYSGTFN